MSRQPSTWFTRPGRIALLATLIAGAPFLLWGVSGCVRTANWVAERSEAPGTVRETVRDQTTRRYYIVVDYTTLEGEEVAFARWIDGPGVFRDGEPVRIMYLPVSPEFSARIVSWRDLWFEAVFQLLLGGLCVTAGLAVFAVTELRRMRMCSAREKE